MDVLEQPLELRRELGRRDQRGRQLPRRRPQLVDQRIGVLRELGKPHGDRSRLVLEGRERDEQATRQQHARHKRQQGAAAAGDQHWQQDQRQRQVPTQDVRVGKGAEGAQQALA